MMGLYLAVFDGGDELDGVEVGTYADFGAFRDAIVENLEDGAPGSRFPVLVLHSDCDGQWSSLEAVALEKELEAISARFRELPPIPLSADWQVEAARSFGIRPQSLYDCFFDVDGEPLLERLIGLVRLSQATSFTIFFQ
jgi:hypothetical protein